MYDLSSNRILPTDYTVDEEVNIKIIANGCDNSNRKDSGGDYDHIHVDDDINSGCNDVYDRHVENAATGGTAPTKIKLERMTTRQSLRIDQIDDSASSDEVMVAYPVPSKRSISSLSSLKMRVHHVISRKRSNLTVNKRQLSSMSEFSTNDECASIQQLIDHLTAHKDNCGSQCSHHKEFNELTNRVTSSSSNHINPELHRIFKSHGWIGARYRYHGDWSTVANLILQDLSNYYLRQSHPIDNLSSSMRASNQLNSFIPDCLLTYLKTHSSLNTTEDGIQSFTFTGACMLPDISGFSKFSGEMCSKGVSGLDELRESINGFLGHIVETVYEYDGDGKNVIHSSYHE